MDKAEERSLEQLLVSAIEGDERAYFAFLEAVAKLVRTWLRRKVTHGSLDVEDVVQETLLAIHLKRHTWRSTEPVRPWIFAIANHKLIDAFRRHGRLPLADSPALEAVEAAEPEVLQGWEIDRALQVLTPGQRSVVTAVSIEGSSIQETARDLGMNETAVRVALHRGLSAIARRFGRT
ncbi:sigma-70 family RNA polymerase sigma factor [Mycoplana sp. MJR14]|uniref:sigma-70 family RNA polymerase sigma factor n=1 Tax=Mycoplana sp. MJR14 TaxID=3032583 RepID=UPI0011D0FBA4|nr:sigma-70 family RNA polymerase sigma factor [Mycoplana sp. MJR14]MDF1634625.1 sigma-70 family RNA polymerase sigma factor [Mycoplana sp. MJR14]